MVEATGEATGFSANDNKRLSARIRLQQGNDDDLMGAPAAAVYESKAGGIVDVLFDLKEGRM